MRTPRLQLLLIPLVLSSEGHSRASKVPDSLRAVLDSIAVDLPSNNRSALVARYDRRGTFFLGNWGVELVPFDSLSSEIYGSEWQPPVHFEWRHVNVETVGPGSAIVYAQFLWRTPAGDSSLTSYTGVFVNDGKRWRIRSEHESPDEARLKRRLCAKDTTSH